MNVSIFFRNIAITFAGRAAFSWQLAIVLSLLGCNILVTRKKIPAYRCDFNVFLGMNIQSSMWRISSSLAVWTSNHSYFLTAAGAVMTAVSCTYRAAHYADFLKAHIHHATAPKAAHPIRCMISAWMILRKRQEMHITAHMPANSIRKA